MVEVLRPPGHTYGGSKAIASNVASEYGKSRKSVPSFARWWVVSIGGRHCFHHVPFSYVGSRIESVVAQVAELGDSRDQMAVGGPTVGGEGQLAVHDRVPGGVHGDDRHQTNSP
jgi:hypothetical protein